MGLLLLVTLNSCGGNTGDSGVGLLKDVTPPAITLSGPKTVNIHLGDTYVERGATATDDRDGTVSVAISQSVDTSKEGNYTVSYVAVDQAGNSTSINRIVIVNNVINHAAAGRYKAKRYPANGLENKWVVYSPEGGIKAGMPVAIFLEGGGSAIKIDQYRGIMEFMATKGYFVIGAESGNSYNSDDARNIVQSAIDVAVQHHGLTLGKVAVMGHSQGGGQAFYVMKKLQEKGYGNVASLTLSIDGWFSFTLDKEELAQLRGDVSFVQMNGLNGTGTDPRIHLSIWNIAKNTDRKFYILPQNEHGYVRGTLDSLLNTKKDLLSIVGGLTHDAFNDDDEGENAIEMQYKTTFNNVLNALGTKASYSDDCEGKKYNARKNQLSLFDIDYCTPEAY